MPNRALGRCPAVDTSKRLDSDASRVFSFTRARPQSPTRARVSLTRRPQPSHHAGFAGDVVEDGAVSPRHRTADASEDAFLARDPLSALAGEDAARETDDAATAAAVAAAGAELDAFLASDANAPGTRDEDGSSETTDSTRRIERARRSEEAFAEVLARRDRAKTAIGELSRRVEDVQRELNALDEEEDLELEAREEEEEEEETRASSLAATPRGDGDDGDDGGRGEEGEATGDGGHARGVAKDQGAVGREAEGVLEDWGEDAGVQRDDVHDELRGRERTEEV